MKKILLASLCFSSITLWASQNLTKEQDLRNFYQAPP